MRACACDSAVITGEMNPVIANWNTNFYQRTNLLCPQPPYAEHGLPGN